MSGTSRARITLGVAALALALLSVPVFLAPAAGPASPGPAPGLRPDPRAAAVAALLDAPAGYAAVDEGLSIAEALRKHYGIDTGDAAADRLAAARRAEEELLAPLRVTPQQVEQAARALGYSLEPSACANFCDNVYRLALLSLHKQAIREALGIRSSL